jgi:hypothetical protein
MKILVKSKLRLIVFKMIHLVITREPIAVVVVSLGRSGSTMLVKQLVKGLIRRKWYSKITNYPYPFIIPAWDLSKTKFLNGFIYKSHDYPINLRENVKFIFTYSDPIEIIASLVKMKESRGEEWIKEHYLHLKSTYLGPDEYLRKDALNLEKLFKCWQKTAAENVYLVHLDNLWDEKRTIEEFLGFSFGLPDKRDRASQNYDLINNHKLIAVYRSLIDQIDVEKKSGIQRAKASVYNQY